MEHVKRKKFTEKKEQKIKVEEIQLTNLGSLGSLASNKVEKIQLANLVSPGSLASKKKTVFRGKTGHFGRNLAQKLCLIRN